MPDVTWFCGRDGMARGEGMAGGSPWNASRKLSLGYEARVLAPSRFAAGSGAKSMHHRFRGDRAARHGRRRAARRRRLVGRRGGAGDARHDKPSGHQQPPRELLLGGWVGEARLERARRFGHGRLGWRVKPPKRGLSLASVTDTIRRDMRKVASCMDDCTAHPKCTAFEFARCQNQKGETLGTESCSDENARKLRLLCSRSC